ncbi:alpha-N-acetylglucosaminidase TIM-barrel domain-containing protein [Spirillospora sp. CA-294931]|uniref:alpha-N-acetylglucosaminidase n=1 Tax=Spirillospora sp. CA-294931 TaxID=3240042 RepID=UPI003D8EAD09
MLRRRTVLASGAALAPALVVGTAASGTAAPPSGSAPAQAALRRLAGPRIAAQIRCEPLPGSGGEVFRISGEPGRITIAGTSPAVILTGFNWYLKYVAHGSIGWDGEQLDLPAVLPAPDRPIERRANVAHRLFGNDIWTDYTGPHWTTREWKRELDLLALHGYNEVFMPIGLEEAAHLTFQEFGYSRAEMLRWTPPPCHLAAGMWQGGWTLADGGISEKAQRDRVRLGQKILARMRELGLTPLIPGFVGFVPDGFAERNPGARVVDRGHWFGQRMLSWLDPRTDLYQRVAARFYEIQDELFGRSTMYAMNPFTEGGTIGIPLKEAGAGIQKALQTARPGALWQMHAWHENPRPDLIQSLDPKTTLIVDFQSDRFPAMDREKQWGGTPYAFGSVWNYGGHTTMGGNLKVWNERYWQWRSKPGSAVVGVALSPEAGHGDALPLEFFGELAWRDGPVDFDRWFADYAHRRYGTRDGRAERAWLTLGATAYALPADGWHEPHDSLFGARPSLTATTAAAWSPTRLRYDATRFATALDDLLAVPRALRRSSAYRYDLVSVARQVLDNHGRVLLPRIKKAYDAKDRTAFAALTTRWLDMIALADRLVGTVPAYLLGPWIAQAHAAGADTAEKARFVADAKEVLTTWGDRRLSEADLHDYCNRGWNGLLGDLYHARWKRYFTTLETALSSGNPPAAIDWYAVDEAWKRGPSGYRTLPEGSPYALALQARDSTSKP